MTERVAYDRRVTKETDISAAINFNSSDIAIDTDISFLNHLLYAMAFHGRFGLTVTGRGDTEVDCHHLVEDIGLVLGTCLKKMVTEYGPVHRFGYAVIPMDEAAGEVTIDVSNRPHLVFKSIFPQEYAGTFQVILLKEFFQALANSAGITLHIIGKYGDNSHHLAEALFKALGKAIQQAYIPEEKVLSTKGSL